MKSKILLIGEDKCTGCSICARICHAHAIHMAPDAEGFYMPVVDLNLCTKCGVCANNCPIANKEAPQKDKIQQKVLACQANNTSILVEATAGGLFPLAAQWVLKQKGVVFGAAYNKQMQLVHCAADNFQAIARFNGSKYIQSDISCALDEAREYLRQGRTVLFSGTPCQIDAVKRYCKSVSQNLYTIDLVCYGVPSPKLFRMYLDSLEQKCKSTVVDFRFRDKHVYGWSHTTVVTMRKENGEEIKWQEPDYRKIDYYKMFGARNCFRKSCYNCQYNTLHRYGDITTGNFWGIEKISTAFDAKLGVSMAIINSAKGRVLFDNIRSDMIVEEHTIEEAISANDALIKRSEYSRYRDKIYHQLDKYGLEKVIKKYYTENWKTSLRKAAGSAKRILLGNRDNH